MCKNGMIGQFEIIEPQRYENRLNVEAYARSNAFAQNYHSRNYIDIGHRWFNLPDYKDMRKRVYEYFDTHSSIGERAYFDTSHNNMVYAIGERKKKKIFQMPTRSAIAYHNKKSPHIIQPYIKYDGDMSKVYETQRVEVYQNRPDVVLKKIEVGVDYL